MSPRPARPRQLLFRGSVECAALLMDPDLLGEQRARARVLQSWEPGAHLSRLETAAGTRWLLRLARPRRLRVDRAPGLPLSDLGGYLSSVPAPAHQPALSEPGRRAEVILVEGGVLRALAPETPAMDPAEWLDLSHLRLVTVQSLGADPPAPTLSVVRRELEAAALLGPGAQLAPDRERFVAKFNHRAAPSPALRVGGTVARLLAGARRLWRGLAASNAASPRTAHPTAPPGPMRRWLGHARAALDRWVRRQLLQAHLGRKHTRYLRQMLDMFETGDLDSALRHAIPLGDGSDGAAGDPMPWTTFQPRAQLRLQRDGESSGGHLMLGSELFATLRERYRVAFNRLRMNERHSEAAFVLAELLGESLEAAEYLEARGLFETAAELAETKALEPELVVRLWFAAGSRERAVALARRHGAFAGAVATLEKSRPDLADELRVEWAESLAAAGSWGAAVQTLWPVESERARAERWLREGVEQGGLLAARLLPRMATLLPEERGACHELARAIADDDTAAGAAARRALASELVGGRAADTLAAGFLARPVLRGLLADAGAGGSRASARALLAAASALGLQDLEADASSVDWGPAPRSLHTRSETLVVDLAVLEPGALEVHDAARLPDGCVVVALGEAGVRYVSADGATIDTFSEPAHRMAVSDAGDRLVLLAHRSASRSSTVRLSVIDLQRRAAYRWGETRLTHMASTFDGDMLFVAHDDAVSALDLRARVPEALWRVGDLGGPVTDLVRSMKSIRFHVGGDDPSLWVYELPRLRLQQRQPRSVDDASAKPARRLGDGWSMERSRGSLDLMAVNGGGSLQASSDDDVDARVSEREIVLFDARGRIVVVDVDTGERSFEYRT